MSYSWPDLIDGATEARIHRVPVGKTDKLAARQQRQIVDSILQRIDEASAKYHRLVLIVGSAGSGKTSALKSVHNRIDAPMLNVGIELTSRMLELSERERSTQLPRLLSEAANSISSDVVLLDNTEILFDPRLRVNPLQLLKEVSKQQTIVSTWSGYTDNGSLIYAKRGHPEYRRYDLEDLLIVEIDSM